MTPLDLLPLPNISMFKHKDAQAKADFVKKMHEQVKAQIEKRIESYARHANKGRRKVTFEPGDWVWVHLRKERFPSQRKSKLMPRGDGPFQVLEKINDNAYKIELPGEYGVSTTFNVSDLSLYDAGDELKDLRTNAFQGGGNDEDIQVQVQDQIPIQESLQGLGGPMTRARTKKAQEALKQLIATFHKDIQRQLKDVEHKENALILCLKAQVEEEFDTCI